MQEVHTKPITVKGLACWQPFILAMRELRTRGANTEIDQGILRAEQMSAITRLTPWMMFVNLVCALFIVTNGWNDLATSVAIAWMLALTLLCTMTLMSWTRNRHRPTMRRLPKRVVDRAIRNATALGLTWGVMPSILFNASPPSEQLIIITILGGMMAGGAFVLYVIPAAAFAFIASISIPFMVLLTTTNGNKLEPLALVGILYAATLGLIVSHAYQRFLRQLKTRAELREQSQIIGLLLKDFEDASRDWLWETNAEGNLVYVSESFASAVNCPTETLLGEKLTDLDMIEYRDGWNEITEARSRQQGIKDQFCSIKRDGELVWWSITARPMFDIDNNFTGYRGVGSDVTAKVKSTDALRKAKEAAEEANEAKSRFLAMISHELRTPLNAIIGFSDLIKAECHGEIADKRYVDFAADINDGGRHLLTIINDLLDLARIDSQQFKMESGTFDAGEIVDSVSRMTRIAAEEKNISLEITDFDEDQLLRGDFARIRQILINLVFNAIKFTPDEGSIVIRTLIDDNQISFAVEDTGPGIPPEMEETLFEPFRQADNALSRKAEGVGLGLPIARKLAEAHGGTVTLTNGDKGALAELVLPLPDEDVEDELWRAEEEKSFDAPIAKENPANDDENREITSADDADENASGEADEPIEEKAEVDAA